MPSHFTNKFFAANRRALQTACSGAELIIVAANGLLQRGADSAFPFAQDANFWYLTGIDEPDLTLVLAKTESFLIVPGRSVSREAFDGAVSNDELTARSGIAEIVDEETGWKRITHYLQSGSRVAMPGVPPAYIEAYGLYTNPARATLQKRLNALTETVEYTDISPQLSRLRMVKQAPELAAIQAAIDITVQTLQTVTQKQSYRYEYELEADITQGFRAGGAAGHAFEPIVAAGKRACTLHNVTNSGALAANDLVVLDVGAEVEHYAADITRTVCFGTPNARQQEVYAAVLDVQQYAKNQLRAGVLPKEYEQQIEAYMGKALQNLGLITEITHEKVRTYYPHATSHFLGLNVHDVGDYTQGLPAGAVVTVEPGIYIPAEGIGVRIEDDVLIAAQGIEVLSAAMPNDLG